MAKTKPTDDGKTQRQRFIEAAKSLGADMDAESFRSIVRKVATAETPTKAKKAAKKRRR